MKKRVIDFFQDVKKVFRERGLRGVLKTYGWKIVVIFFLYYLIRDSILYILIPYLVYKGIAN